MRCGGTFWLSQSAIVAVVVMQSTKFQPGSTNRPCQFNNFFYVTFSNPCAIHSGIDVQKQPQTRPTPLLDLVLVFGKSRNRRGGKLFCDFTYASCVCANGWISKQHVCCAVLARNKKFQRRRALEIANAACDQSTHGVPELG